MGELFKTFGLADDEDLVRAKGARSDSAYFA